MAPRGGLTMIDVRDDIRSIVCIGGVPIGMVEMPMCFDEPPRHIM
jgi:hypothetical protein